MLRNDPKFSDTQALANIADPDQAYPRGALCSGSTLLAIPSTPFVHNLFFRKIFLVEFWGGFSNIFSVLKFRKLRFLSSM